MYSVHFIDKSTAKWVRGRHKFKHKSLKEFLDEYYEPDIEALDTCALVILTDIHMKNMSEARRVAGLLEKKLKNAMPGYNLRIEVYEQIADLEDFIKEDFKYYLIQAHFED